MEGKFNQEISYEPPQNQSLEQTREEVLSDVGEVVQQGNFVAEAADTVISDKLEQAKILQEELGEPARPVVDQIQELRQAVEEERAAFEARAERLALPSFFRQI